ncbi:ABC transporter ATP-binding protein [Mogibacterium sp.]
MYLKIDNIKKSYGTGDSRVDVLKGINCGVNKGEICVLLGPSGSGKSTLLNILGGIDKADNGSVTIGEDKIENFNDKQLSQYRRKHLGYIFQSYNLVPNLTVRENIEVGAYLSDKPLPIDELIELLGLEAHKNKRPNQLSGGQQQRTSIGRAIVKNPDLLLCDEPTGALDYNTSKEILKLVEDINIKYGTTIVIVTHNVAISQMAHQVINLHDGRIRSDEKNNNRLAAELIEW